MDQAKQSTNAKAATTAAIGQPGSSESTAQAPAAKASVSKAPAVSTESNVSSIVNQKLRSSAKSSGQTPTKARETPGAKQDPPAPLAALQIQENPISVTASSEMADGNDQVTKETPNQPLVPSGKAAPIVSNQRQSQPTTQQPASTERPMATSQSQAAASSTAPLTTIHAEQQSLLQISHQQDPSARMPPCPPAQAPSTSQPSVAVATAPSQSAQRTEISQSHSQTLTPSTTQPCSSLSAASSQSNQPPSTQPKQAPGRVPLAQTATAQNPEASGSAPSVPIPQNQPQHAPVIDHQSLYEEQISQQRSVLVDRYAPYIEHSDRSLNDARNRLETALKQVRQLRAAFTERVYGKYRVCLKPPEPIEETLHNIKSNPIVASRKLEQEIRHVKEEKDLEKKEAQSLNAEISKMDPKLLQSVSADNAEQLMYISAGLSLVILPEDDVDPKLLEGYQDRAPINQATGQRVRSISQAAAAAGEVILERTRKAKAMRKQFQHQRKSDQGHDMQQQPLQTNNRSPLELLTAQTPTPTILATSAKAQAGSGKSAAEGKAVITQATTQGSAAHTTIAPKVDPKVANLQTNILDASSAQVTPAVIQSSNLDSMGLKKPITPTAPPPSTSKFGRSRGGAGISVHVSLSLNPTADEITEKPSRASTAALLARGVGTAQGISRASPQQRLRHPHPESAGGKQRASSATSAKKELASLKQALSPTTSQSYLNFALPPLPTPLERRERKPLAVLDASRSGSIRAKRAIASVLGNVNSRSGSGFGSKPSTKIALLHDIHKSKKLPARSGPESPRDRPIDPTLAFSVLQAIGLITEAAENGRGNPLLRLEDKVAKLPNGEKRKLESLKGLTSMWDKLGTSKKPRFSDAYQKKVLIMGPTPAAETQGRPATAGNSGRASPPVEKIRGGGVANNEASEASSGRNSPPVESIRGGGEMLPNANGDPSAPSDGNSRKNNQRAGGAAYVNHVSHRVDNRMMANNMAHTGHHPQPRWDGQGLNMMNTHMAANSVQMGGNHAQAPLSGQVGATHPGQAANANNAQAQSTYALHLAHQLRNATNNMGGMQGRGGHGEVSVGSYMGGIHQHGQWSSLGTSAAVMAAAQSSLAALGLSVPMGVYSSVQDRAARAAMLAREQQNVAAAHAVAAHQQSVAHSGFPGGAVNPGFAPTNAAALQQQRANARNVMLNSAAQTYGVLNQSSVVTPMPQQHRSGVTQASPQVSATVFARNGAQPARKPEPQHQQRAAAPAQRAKRKADEALKEKAKNDNQRASAANPTAVVPKKPKQGPGGSAAAATVRAPLNAPKTQLKVATDIAKPPAAATVASAGACSTATSTQKGMHFLPPMPSPLMTPEQATLVRTGQLHKLAGADYPSKQPQNSTEILEFLVAVGTAVPIPKALILTALKDRLNIPGFKNLANSAGYIIPRDIIVAAILVWLWCNHEQDFQRAFSINGRIDVDATCKWLVNAAVDASVRALTQYITDTDMATGIPRKMISAASAVPSDPSDKNFSVGLATACVVSRSLTTESCKDDTTDHALPQFHELTNFLDECRLVALHSRSQERVLLASLISLKSVMSESFAHAYVSSIVRAGDALGHETLAEIVADDDLKISSMMPYDILRDETGGGGWEDPGRPIEGFSPNLTGDVLTKVAHARAIIQKSLRRLQDRHSIKGGTPTFGPYADLANGQSQTVSGGSSASNAGGTPKSFKRRVSTSLEGPVPDGTGSAPATSWALYDPKHFSAPLAWNPSAPENTPYGRHRGGKPSSLGPSPSAKRQKKSLAQSNGEKPVDLLGRSTFEIDWNDVADSFHDVKLQRGASAPIPLPATPAASLKTIISPFCRKLEETPEPSEEESDTEEDLSDEAVLERHQIVLDGMKDKLSAFMEARKKMQERRRKSQKSNS